MPSREVTKASPSSGSSRCSIRPGDIAECYADPGKALRELGWKAQYGIEEMCASSYKWQSMNPDGYKG